MNEPTYTQWRAELDQVMPADFKDWWDNSPRDLPLVAALVIRNLRERAEEAEAQLEVMGKRMCGNCSYWHHIEAGDGECYHDKNIDNRSYNGDDFVKIDICGPDFGCCHWKRKEG